MIWWVVLLFAAGMALILAEFFVPGAILGILGGALILLSAGLGIYYYPDYAVLVVVAEVLGVALSIAGGIFMMSKLGLGGGLMLQTSQEVNEGYVNVPTNHALLGAMGSVLTPLRPAGTIVVGDERIDAVADGAFIPVDAVVRIIEVKGNRVVVEQVLSSGAEQTAGGMQNV